MSVNPVNWPSATGKQEDQEGNCVTKQPSLFRFCISFVTFAFKAITAINYSRLMFLSSQKKFRSDKLPRVLSYLWFLFSVSILSIFIQSLWNSKNCKNFITLLNFVFYLMYTFTHYFLVCLSCNVVHSFYYNIFVF